MVMEAVNPLVTPSHNILLLAGIPWYAFALICIVVILVALIIFILWKQRYNLQKYREQARGKVALMVLPSTGGTLPIEWELCPYHKGETKTIEDQSRGTFSSAMWAEAPKGHSVDSYLLPDEHDYCMWWPIFAPKNEQVIVPVYVVHKNFPWPECPHDASKWDNDKIIKRSSAMFNQSNNESSLQIIMSPQMAFAEQLRILVEKFKWVLYSFFSSIGTGALQIISLVALYMMLQKLDIIAKFITGK